MPSLEKEIMVVHRNKLFDTFYFGGFLKHDIFNFESRILENHTFMIRRDAENNPDYKQPIPYMAIINPSIGKIFGYYRSKEDEHYKEKRLQGKFSIGIGGHIDKNDYEHYPYAAGLLFGPIFNSLRRELEEEVKILGEIKIPKLIGYINDDSDDVGRVHFGVLYYVETNARTIKPKDREIAKSRWFDYKQLEKLCNNVNGRNKIEIESWTKIAIPPVADLLSSL